MEPQVELLITTAAGTRKCEEKKTSLTFNWGSKDLSTYGLPQGPRLGFLPPRLVDKTAAAIIINNLILAYQWAHHQKI
jgi:hypothetical protein